MEDNNRTLQIEILYFNMKSCQNQIFKAVLHTLTSPDPFFWLHAAFVRDAIEAKDDGGVEQTCTVLTKSIVIPVIRALKAISEAVHTQVTGLTANVTELLWQKVDCFLDKQT